jgi:hypothetical protein
LISTTGAPLGIAEERMECPARTPASGNLGNLRGSLESGCRLALRGNSLGEVLLLEQQSPTEPHQSHPNQEITRPTSRVAFGEV